MACGSQKWNGNWALLVRAPKQDQDQGRQVQAAGADLIARGQHLVEVVASDDVPDQQDADKQAQPAGGRDRQRHARAVAGAGVVMPVADEQEREQAGQLPEEDQLDQVAREHDAQHGAHEGEQEREEARHRILGRHVVARVEHDQEADAGDQHGEQPGEAVHAQAEVEAQGRHPLDADAQDAAMANGSVLEGRQDGGAQGHRPCQEGSTVPGILAQEDGNEAPDERKGDDGQEGQATGHG